MAATHTAMVGYIRLVIEDNLGKGWYKEQTKRVWGAETD